MSDFIFSQNSPQDDPMAAPRVAVIGGGHLGRIHARLLAARSDVSFVAVCDPIAASRAEVESKLNLPTLDQFESLEGRVDAVVIATPTTLHHKIGKWCLERGIHTFMEKPIATNEAEAYDLIRTAERVGCQLQVGHVERFNPAWTHACERIDATSVRHIDARREGVYTGRSTDIGIVLDLMIHDIDLILSLIASPLVSIHATGRCVLGRHEDFAVADLVFKNGATAHLRASRISATQARAMEIHCDTAWAAIDFATNSFTITEPTLDVASGRLLADELPMPERLAVKDELFTRWLQKSEHRVEGTNAIADEHTDFLHAIASGTTPRVSGREGARALQVACEIADQIAAQTTSITGIIPASRLAEARRKAG